MWQGMVDRAELLAALSENKTLREDAQDTQRDLTLSETQLGKAREQLEQARLIESLLRSELSSMVPRSELESRLQELERLTIELGASRAEARELTEDNSRLEQKLLGVKIEIDNLKLKIEVPRLRDCLSCCRLWAACTQARPPGRAWWSDLSSWLRYRRPMRIGTRPP